MLKKSMKLPRTFNHASAPPLGGAGGPPPILAVDSSGFDGCCAVLLTAFSPWVLCVTVESLIAMVQLVTAALEFNFSLQRVGLEGRLK